MLLEIGLNPGDNYQCIFTFYIMMVNDNNNKLVAKCIGLPRKFTSVKAML